MSIIVITQCTKWTFKFRTLAVVHAFELFYLAFNDVIFGLDFVNLIILYHHVILTPESFVLPFSVHHTHSAFYYNLELFCTNAYRRSRFLHLFSCSSKSLLTARCHCCMCTVTVNAVDSVWPLYGPVAGGTRVTISGQFLSVSTVTAVYFGQHEGVIDKHRSAVALFMLCIIISQVFGF